MAEGTPDSSIGPSQTPGGGGGTPPTEKPKSEPGSPRRRFGGVIKGTRNLRVAIITGLVLAALALGLLFLGRAPFFALVLVLVLLAQGEFYVAVRKAGYDPAAALGLTAGAMLLVGSYLKGEAATALVLFLTVVFTFVWYMSATHSRILQSLSVTLLGVIYVPLLGSFLALMLRMNQQTHGADGRGVALAVIGGAALYDTFAYAGGSRWGRRALAPSISPGKTVEGAVIATAGLMVVAALLAPVLGPWSIFQSVVMAILISVAAPTGDLFESMMKRDLGIKDMGSVFPGHGGAMDRFDAILFAAPVGYLSLRIFGLY